MRIELDGDWAEVYPEMIHKTTKLLDKLLRTSLGDSYQKLQEDLRLALDEEAKKVILRKIQIEGEDEITLLNQVTEWSFGAVTQEVLDHIPSSKYLMLVTEVDKLYSQIPLAPKS